MRLYLRGRHHKAPATAEPPSTNTLLSERLPFFGSRKRRLHRIQPLQRGFPVRARNASAASLVTTTTGNSWPFLSAVSESAPRDQERFG